MTFSYLAFFDVPSTFFQRNNEIIIIHNKESKHLLFAFPVGKHSADVVQMAIIKQIHNICEENVR